MKNTAKQLAAGTFLAILLTVVNINAKGTELKTSTTITETTFDVENWMIDEMVWDIKSFVNYEIIDETETGLGLEYWMTSEETWNLRDNIAVETKTELIVEIVNETETGLELEYWMTSDKTWSVTDNIVDETETELIVENWMMSDRIWNKE